MSETNDWQKFFEELGELLDKYNFIISDFALGVKVDKRIRITSFNSDGKRVFPVYCVPNDILSSRSDVNGVEE